MIESIAFQTRARTIDHLGREQIADCPTAISELWKNSYDAYARNVGLHIYDSEPAIAVIVDDGHGMNREEFTSRWLVVGTESKMGESITPVDDRDGLLLRVKQGQKGIGRLSSANLGSLLLIVSKRKKHQFVASLIDWRLFENPYLFLMDIEIPVVEFFDKKDLFSLLPDLYESLLSNVGFFSENTERGRRITKAWSDFSSLELSEGKQVTTQSLIQKTVIGTTYEERHFAEWPLWRGDKDQGTILAISDLQFDLLAQLPRLESEAELDATARQARAQLFQTLSNLSDPFLTAFEREDGYGVEGFSCKATARDDKQLRVIIDNAPPFDLDWLYELEHVLDGKFDEQGVFRGKVKAFGSWVEEEIVILPAVDVPSRRDTLVGEFYLRIGTYEQRLDSTSHSEEAYRSFESKSESYAGFMVYRNGLRVMPYGREGSDFFQIEKRRSSHAGREFWSLRRLFGRVALKKEKNPNLRDKAGREGLIDNKAAKVFRDLVVHVLRTTARQHFGTGSDLRDSIIPDRIEAYKKQKEEAARNKQKLKSRRAFSSKLEKIEPMLLEFFSDVDELSEGVNSTPLDEEIVVVGFRNKLQDAKRKLKELAISDVPRSLGSLEERYNSYRGKSRRIREMLDLMEDRLGIALEVIKPRSARDIVYSELSANAAFLHRRIRGWAQEGKSLLSSEQDRLLLLQEERNKAYHLKMLPLLEDVGSGLVSLREATRQLDEERDIQDLENSSLFESYVSALSSLKESIDLAALAQNSEAVADELREEVDRLHGLAQLGITVEIIGHEIEGLEQAVSSNLRKFPDEVKNTALYCGVRDGYEALVERLRFLSPLKLSGPKTRVRITGLMILEYVQGFFGDGLTSKDILLTATAEFLTFSIVDQPARIYPVFINLINNSAYWVSRLNSFEKQILLDVNESGVFVSDNGPGVDIDDVKYLFQIFFTRKVRGGRGVGLYLCRANLAASGHVINYASKAESLLSGANFVIKFRGAKYD
ncbi:MAG: ATP-binding protein [Pseudomonadales bacterium]|nr:ATP-binding protein [Pseudomonadales bacterium]